ncbi:60s ribosomal protein l34 [Anaeramoeba flamelloides]|uniref:60s ribosomal protein l34 n=1 Tax=Anaeramoeba flamelloides TaxID=1746091 RepID=A0ABQ8X303_9EUKA|nr:60s ribosomal protein l34 [Anaeramoeba flamelloides]
MPNKRITHRRKHAYNTNRNRVRVVKTPGGRLTGHYILKRGKVPVCDETGEKLRGIKSYRPIERSRAKRRTKTVSRAYGGCKSANCVKDRIIRAFLREEQRIVQRVLKAQQKK